MSASRFPPLIQSVLEEFTLILKNMAGDQRYAIAVSGSLGKGNWDNRSDVDLRLYTENRLPGPDQQPDLWGDYFAAIERWKARNVIVDDMWPRTIEDIETALDRWLNGEINPMQTVWTIWGYHILTDMNNQSILDDPYHIIGSWKDRLHVYPAALRQAILTKYVGSLRYWRSDYHYAHKVERGDVVFLAGITARLVHEIIQILFALNETYFVGDGANLDFVEKFTIVPADFSERIHAILYPHPPDAWANQYDALTALIDEVITLTGL